MQKDVQVALVEGSEDIGGSESRYQASGEARPGGHVREYLRWAGRSLGGKARPEPGEGQR